LEERALRPHSARVWDSRLCGSDPWCRWIFLSGRFADRKNSIFNFQTQRLDHQKLRVPFATLEFILITLSFTSGVCSNVVGDCGLSLLSSIITGQIVLCSALIS
jgi:hypothetical protein